MNDGLIRFSPLGVELGFRFRASLRPGLDILVEYDRSGGNQQRARESRRPLSEAR
jgi:hypothetical protein